MADRKAQAEACREFLVSKIAADLETSISNLGYPVGLGIAPHPDTCRQAAERIIERIQPKALELLGSLP
jgi:hypothetical protein